MTPVGSAGAAVAVAVVTVLQLTGVVATGHWECTATGSADGSFNVPIKWACDLSESCCLTGPTDAASGCCKDFIYEAVFTYRSGYQACAPSQRRTYYCPSNRECCIVAASGGRNQTGCCVSQRAPDQKDSGSGSFGEYDTAKTTSSSGPSKVTIIVIVVLAVIIVLSGLLGYGVNATRQRAARRERALVRCQRTVQGSARSSSGGDDDTVAFLAPPSYWEAPDGSEAVPENSSGPTSSASPVPTMVTMDTARLEAHSFQPRIQLAITRSLPQYTPVPQDDETVVGVTSDRNNQQQQQEGGGKDVASDV